MSQGLLNLNHLTVQKSKAVPVWMADLQADRQGRQGWVAKPRFRTASEMRKERQRRNMPDQSNDIDGDGVVSAADLRVAARYDVDCDGVLQPEEKHSLRVGLVSETLARIRRMQKAGQLPQDRANPKIAQAIEAFRDVDAAVDSSRFSRHYQRLRACVDIGGSKDSVQVRELINPSRSMRGAPLCFLSPELLQCDIEADQF